ncbi:MAG: sulfur oxidation c-type cytochrome SoxX [Rhodospirillales bacterium]|nr:sulfur oxidation c-type cytochrome SoxX [Rhodospirillales bacterium]
MGLVGSTAAQAQQNLVAYTIVKDGIPQSLTGKPGDPAKGRKLFATPAKGNCLSCHQAPIPEEMFHGKIGPELDEVGARLTAAEMRLRIVNPKVINSDTMMPSYYKIDGLNRVMKSWQGKAILSADEVEDIIAYLQTLK